jgi:biopolymer transport protein ExbB
MMESAKAVIEEESIKLQQKISWIQLIAAIAPMLGLLGTVQGMIGAFSEIAKMAGAPKPKDLAGGIFLALVTTFQGLVVAIPGMIFYFYFRNQLIRIAMEASALIEDLLERFKKIG